MYPLPTTGVVLALATPVICLAASLLEFDYVIVGGGTSGLAVANRLSEIASITVAVIEAGDSVANNPDVTNVDGFTLAFNKSIDWQYESTRQTSANGRILLYHAGKALGGTSTINGHYSPKAKPIYLLLYNFLLTLP
jgi:choline dehydrogenase-like flavoprotein